jgi:exopolysaccharide biosynthesis polyprenyl glycosylphosphotransferase
MMKLPSARPRKSAHWLWSVLFIDLLVLPALGCFFVSLRAGQSVNSGLTWTMIGLMVAVVMTSLSIVGGYERRRDLQTLAYASEHFLALMTALCVTFLLLYSLAAYQEAAKPSRATLILALVTFAPISLIYRRKISRRLQLAAGERFVCILGTDDMAREVTMAAQQDGLSQRLRYFSLSDLGTDETESPTEKDIRKVLAEQEAQCEAVVIAAPYREVSATLSQYLLDVHFHHIPVYPLESFFEVYFKKIPLSRLHLAWALKDGFKIAGRHIFENVKRSLDVGLAAIALLVGSPLLIVVSLLVCWDGPVFFRQMRVGRFGRPFELFKFRTMRPEADREGDYTLPNDTRVTAVGRWLRQYRLDEWPQFWNVLKGEMSLIGPRAEWEKLVAVYEKEIPFYRLRHWVRPGITGWAQVNFPYGSGLEDAREKLQYDLYYVKNYSLSLDAAIVLKTLYVIFSAKGR